MIVEYIDTHREAFGVEPICRELQVAPSTYYAAKTRPPSRRAVEDERLVAEVRRVFTENYGVYGRRKLWRQLNREGITIGRDRCARLMRSAGISGMVRGRKVRTTRPDTTADRAPDLVQRNWTVQAPNRVWVSDFTYVATWSGMTYVAFVVDLFSRRIVGWRVDTNMRTDLVLDALEQASGHATNASTASSPTPTREPNTPASATPNASWRTAEEVELATLGYVDWFNHRRLHSEIGDVPPVELGDSYYRHLTAPLGEQNTAQPSLH